MRVLYVNMVVMSRQNISFLQDVVHTRALIGRVASLHESIVCKLGCVVTSNCCFRCTNLKRV